LHPLATRKSGGGEQRAGGVGLKPLAALLGDARVVHEAERGVDQAERRCAEADVADLDEPIAVEGPRERRAQLEPGLLEKLVQRLVEIIG
jgi:hypothetical protein